MDWLKGKYRKASYLKGKLMISCRFSLKPIHRYIPLYPVIRSKPSGLHLDTVVISVAKK